MSTRVVGTRTRRPPRRHLPHPPPSRAIRRPSNAQRIRPACTPTAFLVKPLARLHRLLPHPPAPLRAITTQASASRVPVASSPRSRGASTLASPRRLRRPPGALIKRGPAVVARGGKDRHAAPLATSARRKASTTRSAALAASATSPLWWQVQLARSGGKNEEPEWSLVT